MGNQKFDDAPEYWANGYSDAISRWWKDNKSINEDGETTEVMLTVYAAYYTGNPPAGEPTAHVGGKWFCLVDVSDGFPRMVFVS